MRFKLDENLPAELLADLQVAGHEAESVPDEGITGTVDPALLQKVRSEGQVLLTLDRGIADVRTYPPEDFAGIVLFRPSISGRGAVLAFVRRHWRTVLQTHLAGHRLVVTDRSIRVS